MISEFFIDIWVNVSGWVLGLMPAMPAVDTAGIGLGNILAPVSHGLTGLGGWVPWGLVAILLPASVAFYLGSLLLRAVKSFIPTISG